MSWRADIFDDQGWTDPVPVEGLPWSAPVSLGGPVNTAVNDQVPNISPDRTTLLFASNRAGSVPTPAGSPSIDIWVATRTWGGQG